MTITNPNRQLVFRSFCVATILVFAVSANVVGRSYAQDNDPSTGSSLQGGEALPDLDANSDAKESNSETVPFQPKKGLSFLQLLSRGGWFMIPLGLLSIAVVSIGVERFMALRREKLFPKELVKDLSVLSQSPGGLDPRLAYQICQRHPSSAAYVIRAMLTRVGRPQLEIESAVNEASQREAARLSHLGSWLTLAAAIAPLIGLLGTVWGITQAFYDTTQLVAGQNRAEALAQGIYTALVTTMCGLMIAIPAAIMAHHFENRIISILNEIEEMIYSLMPQFERYEGQLRYTTLDAGSAREGDGRFSEARVDPDGVHAMAEVRNPVNGPENKRRSR